MSQYIKMEQIPEKLGIKRGENLFISSDMRRLLRKCLEQERKADLDGFINGLQSAVGSEGTIMIPTYNWDFCSGKTFDYKNTQCKTGILGTETLKRKDFIRTLHPIYSFAVWGKHAHKLAEMENTDSFGPDSPFAFMREEDFTNIIIDVPFQHSFTYAHYVEERTGIVPYRYIKQFTAKYIDRDGRESERTYSMFVRDLDMDVKVTIDPMEEIFLGEGAQKTIPINDSVFRIINLRKADVLIERDIRENGCRRICTYMGQDRD